ncbi:MAG: (d)CMP kinase, partial [Paludibacteraceae bacterium]|nr:(d)CMP kinase [Paludibacteraceae bacterium]
MKKIVVAIDGFSSCGKSTMAKDLARKVGYIYIDTGAMYRAVSLYALRHNLMNEETIDEEELQKVISKIEVTFKPNEQGCSETFLNGENVEKQIRTLEVANGASRVSTLKFVREHYVALQREIGSNIGGVMDGRDIGTVVFPDAELKIFLTASPEVRAKRRYDELKQKGMEQPFDEVLSNLKERDFRDQNRKESPLKQADDALLLDNSSLTLQEQTEWL